VSDKPEARVVYPELEELLPDSTSQQRLEEASAAAEAAALVRMLRRQALSATGTRGITQTELARRTGLTPPRISQIEKGEGANGPTYAVIRKIAFACGVDWGRVVRRAIMAAAGVETVDVLGFTPVSVRRSRWTGRRETAATPVTWEAGEPVAIMPSLPDTEAQGR